MFRGLMFPIEIACPLKLIMQNQLAGQPLRKKYLFSCMTCFWRPSWFPKPGIGPTNCGIVSDSIYYRKTSYATVKDRWVALFCEIVTVELSPCQIKLISRFS